MTKLTTEQWLIKRIALLQQKWDSLMLQEPKDINALIKIGSQKTAYNCALQYLRTHKDIDNQFINS